MAESDATSAAYRIRDLRKRTGLSMEALARRMGLARQSSYQRYENPEQFRASHVKLEFAERLAAALIGQGEPAISPGEVYALAGAEPPKDGRPVTQAGREMFQRLGTVMYSEGESSDDSGISSVQGRQSVRFSETKLPVYGVGSAGEDGRFLFNGEKVGEVVCIPQLENVPGAYAVYVSGNSMEPRYFPGETVYVHPNRPPRQGNFVVVQVQPDIEGDPPYGYIKRFVSWNEKELVLEQFNPAKKLRFAAARVISVDTIMGSADG